MARKIVIEFLGDSKDLQKAMGDADSKGGRLSGTLMKVGKVAATGLAVGGALAAKGLWDATQAAGDMNETLSKTNAIFGGKAAKGLETWADGAATALGQSKQTALDAAATFGTFGKAAGKSGDDLAKFAKENTQLAADLASFHNTSPEQAIEAIGAAFRGEAEPMRAYGVLLDDASMRQQALKMGLIETTSQALTPQQKVLAAQALMMKQTTDAQGDFAKTSGGLANQQKILKAELANVSVEIGTKLLPAATAVATWFNDKGLPAIKAFGGWLEQNFPPVFEKIQSVVNTVMGAVQGDVGGGLGRVQQIFADVTSIVMSLWNTFGSTIIDYAVKAFANVQQIIGGALDVVQGIFQTFSALLKGDWSGAWDGIKKILSGAWEIIKGLVKQGLNVLSTAMEIGWTVMKGLVGLAWDGIKTLVSAGIDKVVDWVKGIPGKFASALSNLKETAAGLFRDAMDAGKEKVTSIGQTIVGWIAEIPGKLLDKLSSFKNAGASLIGAFVDGMKNAAGVIEGIAGNVWSAVRTLLNSALDKVDAALTFTIDLPGPKDISFNPPIPRLAKGGIVSKPTLALIGEDGPEAVVPLSKKHNPGGVMPGMGGGAGGVVQTIVQLVMPGGKVIEQILIQHERDTGRPLGVHSLGAIS